MQLMIALAVIAPLVLAFVYRHNKTHIIEQVAVHEVEKQLPAEVREIPLSIPTPPVVTEGPTPAPTFSERVKNIFRRKKPAPKPVPVIRKPQTEYKAPAPVVVEPPVVTRLNCLFPFSLIPGCYVQVF